MDEWIKYEEDVERRRLFKCGVREWSVCCIRELWSGLSIRKYWIRLCVWVCLCVCVE